MSVSRAIAEGPDGLEIVPTMTRRPHRVELDERTTSELRRHRRAVLDRAAAADVSLGREAFVFSHRPDGAVPWCPNWITKTFIDLRSQVGLAGYRLHDLRHFTATEMLVAGVPIPIVAARLAHARASTTLKFTPTRYPAVTATPPTTSPSCSSDQ